MSMRSTRDTLLSGAQISGERVEVDTGGNLIMQSQQDSDNYDAKQSSVSGGVSVAIFGAGGSASLSMSRDKLHSNYDSVQEQTGIFAGKGGYDIKVNQHTQLDGAVIASTATPEKNRLDTGTLGFSDIHNQADFKAEHQGGSISSGGPVGSDLLTNLAGAALSGAGNKGHAEGTTKAAVSGGSVVIRDGANQQQDVNALSRDTDNANGSIGPIFDKEKEQNRLKQAQLIGEIAGQTMDIVRTQGDINGLQKAKDKHPGLDATALRKTPEYKAEMQKYGTGSDMQRAAQAVTGALQALAGNNLAGALASGAAPYLAREIKERVGENNVAANAMAHALLGAITAQLNNQSAVAGAVGAGGGELAARVIVEIRFPGRDINSLSEGEKQEVSALSQLAAGLAGGIASDSTAGAVTASQAGKNATENNYLSSKQVDAWSAEMKSCQASGGDCGGVIKKYEELSTAQQKQLISDCATSPTTCQQKYGNVLADSLAVKQSIDRALGEDIPIKMVYDLTATFAHQMQAEGVVATNKVSEALQKEYGLDEVQAGIVASAAASAFGGISKAGKPNYTLNKDGAMLGINGPTVPSKTLWMGKGKERIDVENPAPGKRAGQIHYQDNSNNKYYYDPITQTFPDAPKSVNDKLKDPAFKSAVDKGMTKYLGEK